MVERNKNIQKCDNHDVYKWVLSNVQRYLDKTMDVDKMLLFSKLYEKREALKPFFLQKLL